MNRRIPATETVRMALSTLRSNRLRSLLTWMPGPDAVGESEVAAALRRCGGSAARAYEGIVRARPELKRLADALRPFARGVGTRAAAAPDRRATALCCP